MSKKNIIGIVVVCLIVVGLVWFNQNRNNANNSYSVVYLSTGEVYVGQLSTFPDFELKNAYIFQVTKDATDATKTNFQLNPINEALWAPETLHLIKDNVIFYGPLLSNSKIAQTLAEKGK